MKNRIREVNRSWTFCKIRMIVLGLITTLIVVTTGGFVKAHKTSIRPVSLRCEYQDDPIGIDVKQPSLGWFFETTDAGLRRQKQTAYQILVASSPELLSAGKGDFWDSGLVESDQNVHVIYAGKALYSRARCYWKVRVCDGEGNISDWSDPARWKMGLLERSDGEGSWIGSKVQPDGLNTVGKVKQGHEALLLRKETETAKEIRSATAYICGLGYYELYINGRRVGNHVLDPGFTDYSKRALYVTYDVSNHFKKGRNAIGVILGGGWYDMPTPDAWGFHVAPWNARPKLLLRHSNKT